MVSTVFTEQLQTFDKQNVMELSLPRGNFSTLLRIGTWVSYSGDSVRGTRTFRRRRASRSKSEVSAPYRYVQRAESYEPGGVANEHRPPFFRPVARNSGRLHHPVERAVELLMFWNANAQEFCPVQALTLPTVESGTLAAARVVGIRNGVCFQERLGIRTGIFGAVVLAAHLQPS
jgi:hypothetical protein